MRWGHGVLAPVQALSPGLRGVQLAVRVWGAGVLLPLGAGSVERSGPRAGQQGPLVGWTGGLSAAGPSRGSRSLRLGEPGSQQPSRPPPPDCSPARVPQLLSPGNVVWVNSTLLVPFPGSRGHTPRRRGPSFSVCVAAFKPTACFGVA